MAGFDTGFLVWGGKKAPLAVESFLFTKKGIWMHVMFSNKRCHSGIWQN